MTIDMSVAMWLIMAAGVLGAGLLATEGWLFANLAGQRQRLRAQLDTRQAGPASPVPPANAAIPRAKATTAPPFRLPTATGATVGLDTLLARGRPVLLLFTDPRAQTEDLVADLGAWQADHDDPLTAVVITRSAVGVDPASLDHPGIASVLFQDDFQLSRAYGVRYAPAAVLIRPNGMLAGEPVYGAPAIRTLLERLAPAATEFLASRATAAGSPAIGTPAPAIHLPDQHGTDHNLAEVQGEPRALIFWGTRCHYCDQLANDLGGWVANPPPGAPRPLVVVRGPDGAAASDIGARVVLDEAFVASTAYGVRGTPTAVLVDAKGRIASHPARGVRGVRTLLGLDAPAQPGGDDAFVTAATSAETKV